MKPIAIKATCATKVENQNNGQVRLIVANKDKKNPNPEMAFTLVSLDPNQVREFEINKSYTVTIKPE